MNDLVRWLLILLGVILIAGLITIIRRQLKSLRHAQLSEQIQQVKLAEVKSEAVNSIRVLARCILEEQIEYSEACIRIKVLIDSLEPGLHQQPEYEIFSLIYNSTSHMPTHQARHNVDKRFLFKLDKQRWELEKKHEGAIRAGAQALLLHPLFSQKPAGSGPA